MQLVGDVSVGYDLLELTLYMWTYLIMWLAGSDERRLHTSLRAYLTITFARRRSMYPSCSSFCNSHGQWRRREERGAGDPGPPILYTKYKHTFKLHEISQFG